jgi:hypothetical protein
VQPAVEPFGHVLKFPTKATARHPNVSASAVGAGSVRSCEQILTIETINPVPTRIGLPKILAIGANTGMKILIT